ncbi:MAG: FtsL-like putative cell division protein [Bacteroidota bacterium]
MNAFNTYAKVKQEKKKSVLGQVSGKFDFSFDDQTAIKFVPFFFFLTFLGVIYISNNYYSDRLSRKVTVMEREVNKLRVDYGSRKYEFINVSKFNEIAKKVRGLGLIENNEPVIKIQGAKDD